MPQGRFLERVEASRMTLELGVSGTLPGERRLNGPQTTGRTYRDLSEPLFAIDQSRMDVRVPMRDGIDLMADVYLPKGAPPCPALIAASPYPRQLQNSGVPSGFVEAGASDYFVPRGYAHVIVNLRGTGGSGGTYDFYGPLERCDMHDAVEWIAAQPWCDGNVGGVGISAFAIGQIEAAVEHPAHLRAIFAPLTTVDMYEAVYHGGVLSTTFARAWLASVAALAGIDDAWLRGTLATLAEEVLRSPRVHKRFEHFNGEAALAVLGLLARRALGPPFDALMRAATVEHQVKDAFWQARETLPDLHDVAVPTYLGSDWQNVPLHLPSTFTAYDALPAATPKRMALLGEYGMAWPWESLHVEALAWFDRWLKGIDTGITDGPPIRYVIPGEVGQTWYATTAWPPPECVTVAFALRADGVLGADEGPPGTASYTQASMLVWESLPLENEIVLLGPVDVLLDAASSGGDTAFMCMLRDVAPDGTAVDVTQGCLRAAISEDLTRLEPVPLGEMRRYRIRLVDNARSFARGHRIAVILRGTEAVGPKPMMEFGHAPIGGPTTVTVASSSRLRLSVLPG